MMLCAVISTADAKITRYSNTDSLGVLIVGDLDDGKKVGEWKEFYKSGKLARSTMYKDDKAHGTTKMWYESGYIKQQSTFENGKMVGESLTYYDSYKPLPMKTFELYEKGKLVQVITYFFWNDVDGDDVNDPLDKRIWKKDVYDSGKVYHTEYYGTGRIKHYFEMKNGKKHGNEVFVFENVGTPKQNIVEKQIMWKDGYMDGDMIIYNSKEKVICKKIYKDGRIMDQDCPNK